MRRGGPRARQPDHLVGRPPGPVPQRLACRGRARLAQRRPARRLPGRLAAVDDLPRADHLHVLRDPARPLPRRDARHLAGQPRRRTGRHRRRAGSGGSWPRARSCCSSSPQPGSSCRSGPGRCCPTCAGTGACGCPPGSERQGVSRARDLCATTASNTDRLGAPVLLATSAMASLRAMPWASSAATRAARPAGSMSPPDRRRRPLHHQGDLAAHTGLRPLGELAEPAAQHLLVGLGQLAADRGRALGAECLPPCRPASRPAAAGTRSTPGCAARRRARPAGRGARPTGGG